MMAQFANHLPACAGIPYRHWFVSRLLHLPSISQLMGNPVLGIQQRMVQSLGTLDWHVIDSCAGTTHHKWYTFIKFMSLNSFM